MRARVLAIGATTIVLSLAVVGQALGAPAAKHAPQVTGAQLEGALLPLSAFGQDFTRGSTLDSGHKLLHPHTAVPVSKVSCAEFENNDTVSGWGNTAGATSSFNNPNAVAQLPQTIIGGYDTVVQFGTSGQAASFFGQADAKYRACTAFSVPNPSDTVAGGGSLLVSLLSVTNTKVQGGKAFFSLAQIAFSEMPAQTFYLVVLYVNSGTNVYELWSLAGMNDEPVGLMTQLMHRVQALYPHR